MPFVQHHHGSGRQAIYIGGLICSEDGHHCAVAEGFNEEERNFHTEVHMPKLSFSAEISSFMPSFVLRFVFLMVLLYMWEYFDWNDCLIPNTTTWTRASTEGGYHQMLPQAP
jgi:hypothetical protein